MDISSVGRPLPVQPFPTGQTVAASPELMAAALAARPAMHAAQQTAVAMAQTNANTVDVYL